jgi:hypothetical protein
MKPDSLTNNRIPSSSDLTQSSLTRALFRNSAGHWTVRYLPSLLLGGVLFGILFGFSYPLFLVILSIVGISTITFIFNYYFRGDKFKKQYALDLLKKLEKQTEKKLLNLKENLLHYRNNQGAKQLEQFKQKFETLVDILKSKFDESQLTFNRYYSIAQEVYLSGIDNLNDVVIALKTLESIDVNYINERIRSIGNKDEENMALKKEKDALLRSLQSHKQQEEKIEGLMAQNEQALTQIDEATIAISEISRTKDREAQIDMENSMKALADMAQRSKLYSR